MLDPGSLVDGRGARGGRPSARRRRGGVDGEGGG
uniref:Uncharacterized protein n=1 Tax=Arundo donax TaxID=35708 RepID=A0A0A9L968_ARUDO